MLFNSQGFIILFLPIVLALYYGLPDKHGNRLSILLAASFVFYALADMTLLPIFVASLIINRFLAGIYNKNNKLSWVIYATVLVNVLLLCYFKYTTFIFDIFGISADTYKSLLPAAAPVGISFFTFRQISYLLDLKSGKTGHISFREYCFYIAFFPHLIAGPITRTADLVPQLHEKLTKDDRYKYAFIGISFFIAGLIKKILADEFADMANPVFNQTLTNGVSAHNAWTGTLAYTLQIYFDFSGYTDMAVGVAYLFGLRLPDNFNSPYKATSVADFWQRWHITLSTFLRDYLYIPLGGNRCPLYRQTINILITFIICGIWHGAGLTFIIWGALHGVFVAFNKIWSKTGIILPKIISWALTMPVIAVLWAVFRAENTVSMQNILLSLANIGKNITEPTEFKVKIPLLVIGCLICVFAPNTRTVLTHPRYRPYKSVAALYGVALAVLFLYLGQGKAGDFIYFGF